MEEKSLNSAESLELIQKMTTHTRDKFEQGGDTIFLIWGGIIALALGFSLFFVSTGYLFIAIFVVSMIISGPILNYQAACSKR